MLKEKLYQVTATSMDDGHRCNYGKYVSQSNAQATCDSLPAQMEPKVLMCYCLVDELGTYWEMPTKKIQLSDDKARILAKLTDEERSILGV